jgi:hypothetical protein
MDVASPKEEIVVPSSVSANAPAGGATDVQLAKYEAWAARLEDNIATLARQRRIYFRIFFGSIGLSFIGFFFGPWFGVGAFATGVMFCIAGLYISTTRRWEYERELVRTRNEISYLKRA